MNADHDAANRPRRTVPIDSVLFAVAYMSALAFAVWLFAGIWRHGASRYAAPASTGRLHLRTAVSTNTPPAAGAPVSGMVEQLRPGPGPAASAKRPSLESAGGRFRISAPGAIEGELILRVADRAAYSALLAVRLPRGVSILDTVDRWNLVRLRVADDRQLRELLKLVPSAEVFLNYPVRTPDPAAGPPRTPHGEYFGFGDRSLAWLGADQDRSAWGKGITVAILDGGVDASGPNISHVDLLQSGTYGSGHGTAVAALVSGVGQDVQGIAPAATILSVRVLDADGSGDCFTVAKGIVAAVDAGADIINLCLGANSDSVALKEAVDYALASGVAVVAAAGNDSVEGVSYPARYEGVVAVSAVDAAGQHLYFANRGPEVDIAAPGLGVDTVWSGSQPVSFSGTSAAVPFVSGTLAYLMSANPTLSAEEATALLLEYADDAGYPGQDEEFGAGVLDVGRISARNEPGVTDAAVAANYVPYDIPADAASIPLVVSVQNRGTTELTGAELTVNIDGKVQVLSIGALKAGDTVGYPFALDRKAAASGGVSVFSSVALRGATDANPANNTRGTTVSAAADSTP